MEAVCGGSVAAIQRMAQPPDRGLSFQCRHRLSSVLWRDQDRAPGVGEYHVRDAAEQRRGDCTEPTPTAYDQPRVELVGDLDDPASCAFCGLLDARAGVIAMGACALHTLLSSVSGQPG